MGESNGNASPLYRLQDTRKEKKKVQPKWVAQLPWIKATREDKLEDTLGDAREDKPECPHEDKLEEAPLGDTHEDEREDKLPDPLDDAPLGDTHEDKREDTLEEAPHSERSDNPCPTTENTETALMFASIVSSSWRFASSDAMQKNFRCLLKFQKAASLTTQFLQSGLTA